MSPTPVLTRSSLRLLSIALGVAFTLCLLLLAFVPSRSQARPDQPAGVASSQTVEVTSNVDETCYFLTTTPSPTGTNESPVVTLYLSLPYTGVVDEAHILLGTNNVRPNTQHPIRVNGQVVGALASDGRSGCASLAVAEYALPPQLVRPGGNEIVVSLQTNSTDSFTLRYVALRVRGQDLRGGAFVSTRFPSSYDGQLVEAVVMEPFAFRADKTTPRPLLLLFHGWSGKPIDPFVTSYTPAALERDWFVASPQQRGQDALGPAHAPLASLRSQGDAISLIAYMRSHYPIDADRIYVGGFSMGGMMAATLAAKYPDLFAAAVSHEAIGDLSDWYWEQPQRQSRIITETGGPPNSKPFEYQRRSPAELATNLKNLPIAIIHGDGDTVVPPHHATDIYEPLLATNPRQAELHWFHGNHGGNPAPYGGEWAAQFMENYTRLDNPSSLRLRTDESKSFYWLTIGKRSTHNFTNVDVDADVVSQRITATVKDSLAVDLAIDLGRAGLEPQASYIISQTNANQGASFTAVSPINGVLSLTAPGGRTDIHIFPNRGDLPVLLKLQRGVQGYNAVADTWLFAWDVNANNGANIALLLRPNNVGKALVRFDLQGLLPPNVQITGANLKLYAAADGPDMVVNVHRLLRPWSEAAATYQQAAAGQPWSVPGGAPGADWEAQPIGDLNLLASAGEGFRSVGILPAVRDWVEHPESNHGLVLLPASASHSGAKTLRSSEYGDLSQRPSARDHLPAHPADPHANSHPHGYPDRHPHPHGYADANSHAYPHASDGRSHRPGIRRREQRPHPPARGAAPGRGCAPTPSQRFPFGAANHRG